MTASKKLVIRSSEDVVPIRSEVRNASITAGFSLVNQTKFVTAASELAGNMVIYAAGGELQIELMESSGRKGVRLTVVDQGPGIPDIEQRGWTRSRRFCRASGARVSTNFREIDCFQRRRHTRKRASGLKGDPWRRCRSGVGRSVGWSSLVFRHREYCRIANCSWRCPANGVAQRNGWSGGAPDSGLPVPV
jgi:hypothetical protein